MFYYVNTPYTMSVAYIVVLLTMVKELKKTKFCIRKLSITCFNILNTLFFHAIFPFLIL